MTREQRIVEFLQATLPTYASELRDLEARSHSLPALLRRHGLIQALLFLAGKQGGDLKLAQWLVDGISSALGTSEFARTGEAELSIISYAQELGKLELAAYLLRRDAAVEVAGWLKLFIVARIEEAKKPSSQPGAPAYEGTAAEVLL